MLFKFLGFLLLGTLVVAEIPSYIKICGRKNPDLAGCVKNSVENLREKFRTGMPEFDVPSVEPMKFDGFPILDTDQLKTYAKNVKIYGFSNFELKDLKIDLDKREFNIDCEFKELILDADYDVTARIIVPIQGKGPLHLTAYDVKSKVVMKWKDIMKNGGRYLFFPTMTTKLNVRDYKADFKASNNDTTLQQAIGAAINGGRQELIKISNPIIEKIISEEVLRIANKICKHFTHDELFPDRE